MTRHQQTIINLSLSVLRNAMTRSDREQANTPEVRLALRCLLPHCPEKWPLTCFWESAGQQNEIGRSQGCTAAFNGIVRQLRLAGVME